MGYIERETQIVVRHQAVSIFSEEELGKFIGVKSMERDHIEIECGCKCVTYGDIVGDLKIFEGGKMEITCKCSEDCKQGKLSLSLSRKVNES